MVQVVSTSVNVNMELLVTMLVAAVSVLKAGGGCSVRNHVPMDSLALSVREYVAVRMVLGVILLQEIVHALQAGKEKAVKNLALLVTGAKNVNR